jgi:hypothetical protein
MPKGPQGQKRPADVIGNAVRVMQIATGEADENIPRTTTNPDAQALGAKGGKARAEKLSKLTRKRIAQKAAKARWRKQSH